MNVAVLVDMCLFTSSITSDLDMVSKPWQLWEWTAYFLRYCETFAKKDIVYLTTSPAAEEFATNSSQQLVETDLIISSLGV